MFFKKRYYPTPHFGVGFSATTAIPNKDFRGLRASSPASSFVSVDSDVLRNPLLGIAATVSNKAKLQTRAFGNRDKYIQSTRHS